MPTTLNEEHEVTVEGADTQRRGFQAPPKHLIVFTVAGRQARGSRERRQTSPRPTPKSPTQLASFPVIQGCQRRYKYFAKAHSKLNFFVLDIARRKGATASCCWLSPFPSIRHDALTFLLVVSSCSPAALLCSLARSLRQPWLAFKPLLTTH